MDTETPDPNQQPQPSLFEPFPKVNTYPSGWNLDHILKSAIQRGLLEDEAANLPEIEPLPDWYEKFHEPRTCPPGWDFS